ncbi:DUF317 domain-containing protein [Streptomyces sp. NPDC053048]|uniref:DUF317 domain-containing protein n=1 Tax=Streptomyces sp. NPDC053048 TaxID=3365694 RepID=UPI0037D899A3
MDARHHRSARTAARSTRNLTLTQPITDHPHRSTEPSLPPTDPDPAHNARCTALRPDTHGAFLVSPRYLAGDDGLLGDSVTDALVAAGWSCWTTRSQTRHLFDTDQLRGAEWLPGHSNVLFDGDPVLWEFFARTDPTAPPQWTAYFTARVPHELVTAFATALATAPDVTRGIEPGRTPLQPLADAHWATDPTDAGNTYYAPKLQAWVTYGALSEAIEDGNPLPGLPGYLAWAQTDDHLPHHWCAAFSPSTPQDLVTAFTTVLADPAPVQRSALPQDAAGHLTISLSS